MNSTLRLPGQEGRTARLRRIGCRPYTENAPERQALREPRRSAGVLDHWEERWADTRIHGRTKRQVAAMFAEEKPFLQPASMAGSNLITYGRI